MGKAIFYHLTRHPMEVTLTMLLDRASKAGWRVVVRGASEERMAWLDEKLWLMGEGSFLPHGLAGGAHDDLQPVLLTTATDVPHDCAGVFCIDGAPVTAVEILALERVWVLFDGNDQTSLESARRQWKMLKDAGAQAEYWSEESGSWEMKAQT